MIKATGKINGKEVTLICDENYKLNLSEYQKEFDLQMNKCHSIGGTYYPDTLSRQNALNVLELHMFDYPSRVKIEVINENIEPIPYEDGVIY